MKNKYIIPITELVAVNLLGSILQDVPIGDNSDVGTGMDSNIGDFEEEDFESSFNGSSNLWDK